MNGPAGDNRAGAAVIAFHLSRSPTDETMTLAHEPPWTCTVDVHPGAGDSAAVAAVAGEWRSDATILFQGSGERPEPSEEAMSDRIRSLMPKAELFRFDPDAVLRFLWCFRDAHDPLALARACDRTLFDASYPHRPIPAIRAGKRADRRKAMGEVRRVLRRMGGALGVDLPFPRGEREERAFGLSRICGLIEAGLGLYAGLLHRWGSPLAVVRGRPGEMPSLTLEDRWIREGGCPDTAQGEAGASP